MVVLVMLLPVHMSSATTAIAVVAIVVVARVMRWLSRKMTRAVQKVVGA